MSYQKQLIQWNLLRIRRQQDVVILTNEKIAVTKSNLIDVPWIWESTVSKLMENGIKTQEQLIRLSDKWLNEIIKNPLTKMKIRKFITSKQN